MNVKRENLRILTKEDLVDRFRQTTEFLTQFFKDKAKDYDIEYYKELGGFGLLVRIREKYYRLNNLLQQEGPPKFEPIEDNIKDLSTLFTALYSMIQFDLISLDKLKILYAQALEVDIEKLVSEQDAKDKKVKHKWYQFWKR